MENTNLLRLEWKCREGGGGRTQRDYLDFIVDGQPFSENVGGDLASCLGWFDPEENTKAVRRLMLEEPADFRNNRGSLYVCSECGDLGCGAVSTVIEQVGDKIIWRDFGHQNDYEEKVVFGEYRNMNPLVFNRVEYEKAIKSAL